MSNIPRITKSSCLDDNTELSALSISALSEMLGAICFWAADRQRISLGMWQRISVGMSNG